MFDGVHSEDFACTYLEANLGGLVLDSTEAEVTLRVIVDLVTVLLTGPMDVNSIASAVGVLTNTLLRQEHIVNCNATRLVETTGRK